MSLPPNPFPGPVPLTEKDQLFGREREKKELIDRLIADRLVLLYSPSGAGKSSLLNAGVLTKMRERKFRTHKPIRVGFDPPAGLDVNRYEWSCANSLETAYTGQSLSDIFGQPARDLFIFDQFEEVITRAPGKPEHRLDFFKHLGEALRVPGRWAIFAIREDYLAPVQEYLEWLPTQLASSMRLNILNMEDARKSILRPIEESKAVTFEDGALDALLADLARDGWVEPVQLQVVCKDLWEELDKNGLTKITKALVTDSGSAEVALEKYYGNVVQRIAASDAARKSGVTERAIRNWFGESLISASNTRLQVIKGDEKTGALPTTVVEELEHAHLVRSEKRGSTWCELTHDRLILPVTNSNREWKKTLSLLQREAEVWAKERTPDHLLRGRRLLEGWRWARHHHPDMNAQEADYLRHSLGGLRNRVLIRAGLVVVFLWIAFASLDAQRADWESHNAYVEQTAVRAALTADSPSESAGWALETANNVKQTGGMVDWLIRHAFAADDVDLQRSGLRAAYYSATIAHDPRYIDIQTAAGGYTSETCVWYAPPDASRLWARTGKGMVAIPPDPPPTAQQVKDADLGCGHPTHMKAQSIQFSAPAGWTLFPQPDRIEFDGPGGRPAYSPGVTIPSLAVDPQGRRAAWVTGTDNYVYLLDLRSKLRKEDEIKLAAGDLFPQVVRFSPDGNILAAGSQDYLIRLWHLDHADWDAPVADVPLRGHSDTVIGLAFSADGKQLASYAANREIGQWKIDMDLQSIVLKGCKASAFVPDARRVCASDFDLSVQPLAAGKVSGNGARFGIQSVVAMAMRRDGRMAAALGGDGVMQVVDLETGRVLASTTVRERMAQESEKLEMANSTLVALSDDGKFAASVDDQQRVQIWSIANDKLTRVALSNASGEQIRVRSVAFLPDNERIAWGATDHIITVWNFLKSSARAQHIPLPNTVIALAFSPNGEEGASLDDLRTIHFLDMVHGSTLESALHMPGQPVMPGFGRDGRTFHILMKSGNYLTWKIDEESMRAEACRLNPEACAANGYRKQLKPSSAK